MANAAWQCNPLVHVQTDELELNSVLVELGAEQLRWLSMYGSIDLTHSVRSGYSSFAGPRRRLRRGPAI